MVCLVAACKPAKIPDHLKNDPLIISYFLNPKDQGIPAFDELRGDGVYLLWHNQNVRLAWDLANNGQERTFEVWGHASERAPSLEPLGQKVYEVGEALDSGHELVYRGDMNDLRLLRTKLRAFWVRELSDDPKKASFRQARVPEQLSSCYAILKFWPEAPSGWHLLAHPGRDQFAQCDMDSSSGGWTMVLYYYLKSETQTKVALLTQTLPVLPADGLHSFDLESKQGHLLPRRIDYFAPSELRFYCQSSRHERPVHFKTSHEECLSYARSGLGSCANLVDDWQGLPGHDGLLPAAMNGGLANQGSWSLIRSPFGHEGGATWFIDPDGLEWACDEPSAPLGEKDWLYFEAWVR